MPTTNDQNKLAQFNEFFIIDKKFNVNIRKITHELQSFEQFIDQMPQPFKLASDVNVIDQSALRSIKSLSSVAKQLTDFLNFQSQKITLLTYYILSQQDDKQYRYQGIKFGGGGIVFMAKTAFTLNELLELKIFLLDDNCAVYCCGEVIAVNEATYDEERLFEHQVIFHFIREEDRELLVKASLHEQSKQLQNLAKKRHNASQTNNN